MEKLSEHEKENLDGTNMSTDAKLVLSAPGVDATECPQCGSIQVDLQWIDEYEVLHCICNICDKEWVE